MASTATSRLRLAKQATGDNPNAWGNVVNNDLDLVDEARGVAVVTVNADKALTTNNYSSDEGRRFTLKLTGTGLQGNAPALVTIPGGVDIGYQVHNTCGGSVKVGLSSSAYVTVRANDIAYVYSDGTNVYIDDPTLDTVKPPVAPVAGYDGVAPTDFATLQQTVPTNVALAKAWATQAAGEVVAGQGYSAYYWAQNAASFSNSGKASTAEAKAGTDTNKWMTPATTQDALYKALQVNGRVTKSATTTLTSADRGKFIVLTGSPTINLPTAASDPTFFFWVSKNDGSGTAVIDPSGAETISGLASINVYQEAFLVYTDGTAWYTQGRQRGWVSLGRYVLTGLSATTITITQGFADAELDQIEADFDNAGFSSASTISLYVMKNASAITGATYNTSYVQASGSGTAISAVSTGVAPPNIHNGSDTVGITGRVRSCDVRTSVAGDARVEFSTNHRTQGVRSGSAVETGTASSISGIQFVGSTNFSTFTYDLRGYRS